MIKNAAAHRYWFISALAVLCLCGLFLCFPAYAEESTTTVRVGYYEDGDYMYRNAAGEYIGYDFEFLQEISKFSDLRYDIVDGVSWENTYQLLKEGKIDLLPAVYKNEEREQECLFSEQPMCNIYTTLNVRTDDTRYSYEDFAAFQGMTVGIIKDSVDGENFKSYCAQNNIALTVIPYSETQDLLNALDDGTLDGVAITHLGRNSTFRSVAQFAPSPLYIAISKSRPDLAEAVNSAVSTILLRNPNYTMNLYNKYFSVSNAQKPVFTKSELDYIAGKKTVSAVYDLKAPPFTYTNPDTGGFSGIVADLFEEIAESSGLSFEFSPEVYSLGLQKVKTGRADVICSVAGDYLWESRNNLNTTRYYLRSPTVLIRKNTSLPLNKIAMPQDYGASESITSDYPNAEIYYYSNTEACLNALLENKVNAVFANSQVADYLLSEAPYTGLNTSTLSNYTIELSIGVSNAADPRLFSILDKCIQYTSEESINAIVMENSIKPEAMTVREFLSQNALSLIAITVAVSGLVILLLVYSLRSKSKSNRQIQNLLYRDTLTGLDNLDKFLAECGSLLKASPDGGYALIYSDINQFKTINDRYGFTAGDQLLRAYAQIIQEALRDGERCARVSSDNFVLLLRYTEWEALCSRLTGIQEATDRWIQRTGFPAPVIAAFGVYLVDKAENQDVQLMLDLANYARRNAKNTSQNTIVLYDSQMRQNALLRKELTDHLSTALSAHEFVPYFQPKVNMITGEIIGSEALVRWNHPEHGLLAPGIFIPVFEENGSIVDIDWYIYEAVCRALQSWMEQGLPVYPVSCNFSSIHFDREGFTDRVAALADRYGVPHSLLELEITESIIVTHPKRVAGQIASLREKGFMTAIDDFGSGYSSLGQLEQMAARVLKLDRSFVQRGMLDEREQTVIANIVNLAHDLGMQIVCEGVETRQQADILTRLDCIYAQGFYYSKPVPQRAFEQMLLNPPFEGIGT
ncbi:EAL domain-containing protein [Eubacterium sp. 1001713B170207_170306_E7]|uniref:EAL domain-containing protein n=1 Tax=Eubacterium sp. 1001713B170207_170306_E7 TaxID=2787097 RepID=UPI00189C18D5|nr:EAL domain-containing protein [Eubacterium sp. 1001713B170207_170306_E7]